MSNMGPLDVVLDKSAINEIIVFANGYRQGILQSVDTITSLCQQMNEDESLNGGDGEDIKASFRTIAAGCNKLEKSVQRIVDNLNVSLQGILDMDKGKTTATSTESAKAAANNMGVLKKE